MVLLIALPGEKDFPHRGTIDFVDNQVNPKGGGLLVRGVIANPISKEGVPLFTSGMSVRVRVPTSKPYEALLIPETAIASHPAGKYVFVVGADNKIEVRAITLGPRQDDGLRVVAGGLAKDDLVVVGDLHRIDAGMKVRPKLQE
jgi:multidrug efflux pump subunit AcrA (membrane-fusion protein)